MQHLVSSQRESLAHPNHIVRPAHPAIADALCAAGNRLSDLEPIYDALVDPRVEIAACAIFMVGCFLFSVLAPYLSWLGRLVSP